MPDHPLNFSFSKPTVVIISDENNFIFSLAEELTLLGCQNIFFIPKAFDTDEIFLNTYPQGAGYNLHDLKKIVLSEKNIFPKIDYLFVVNRHENFPIDLDTLDLIESKYRPKITLINLNNNFEPWKNYKERLLKTISNIRFVYLQEIYGPKIPQGYSKTADYLNQILNGSVLKIDAFSSQAIYPLHAKDAAAGIIRATMAPGTNKNDYGLKGERQYSSKEIANKINEVYFGLTGQLKIIEPSFDDEKINHLEIKEAPEGWFPQIGLEEGVLETLRYLLQNQNRNSGTNKPTPFVPLKINKKTFLSRNIFITFGAGIFFVLVLVFFSLFSFYQVSQDLRSQKLTAVSANFPRLSFFTKIAAPILGQDYPTVDSLLTSGRQAVNLLEISEQLFNRIINEDGELPFESIRTAKIENETAIEKLSLSLGLLNKTPLMNLLLRNHNKEIKENLINARNYLIIYNDFLEILPDFLGNKTGKTYLLLFQNNSELRPGGGFIGSYGLISFKNGKIYYLDVGDIYGIDGQLKGHVEPPEELKNHLLIDNWYLRDSNWSPDFSQNAIKAIWFFEKETGRKVDGVIGINLETAKRLIGSIGEITVPDYQQKINADNFYERAEYYSEAGFFPGSKQKEDFLGKVIKALFNQIQLADQSTKIKVAHSFVESLSAKEILIYVQDSAVNDFFIKLNWAGRIKPAVCSDGNENCTPDYLHINEANVGVNKANLYINRQDEQFISLDAQGIIKKKIFIKYQNQSPNNLFPAGDYKNYLRVYFSSDFIFKDCVIIQKGKPSLGCQAIEKDEFGLKNLGFLLQVPVGQEKTVEINLESGKPATLHNYSYLLSVQKQSGSREFPQKISFSYPNNAVVTDTNISVLTEPGKIVYNTALQKDYLLEIKIDHEKNP